MPDEKSISEVTLKELLALAAEIDDAAEQRIALSRAKAIAMEVGISSAAWDAAVQARSSDFSSLNENEDGEHWFDPLLVAFLGLVVGALMGFISRATAGRMDVVTGVSVVIGSLGMAAGIFRGSRRSQIDLAAWWAGVPVGIMLGFGRVLTDPLWFAGLSWLTTTALSTGVGYLLRKLRIRESVA